MSAALFRHAEWLVPLSGVVVGVALALLASASIARRRLATLMGAGGGAHAWRSGVWLDARLLLALALVALALRTSRSM